MLGPTVLLYFGLTPSQWSEWIVSFIFALVGSVILRNLIWLFWPKLRSTKALRNAGFRVDLILFLSIALSLSGTMPVPLYGNPLFNFLLKLFFVILILRQWDQVAKLVLTSKEVFSKLSVISQLRWQYLLRLFFVLWLITFYGFEYVPVSLLGSWAAVVFVAALCAAAYPLLRDMIMGWMLLESFHLQIGQRLKIKTDKEIISGEIVAFTWSHLILAKADAPTEKKSIRWSEVYHAQLD